MIGVDFDFEVKLLDLKVDAHSEAHAAVVGTIHILRRVLLLRLGGLSGRHLLLGHVLRALRLLEARQRHLLGGLRRRLRLHSLGAVQVLAHFLGGRILLRGVMGIGWLLIEALREALVRRHLLVALGHGMLRHRHLLVRRGRLL